jgi:hypothetical protein
MSFIILVFIAAYIMGFLTYEVSKMVNPPQVSTNLRQQLETAGLIDKTTNQLDLKALTAAISAASVLREIRSAGFLKAGEIDTEKLAAAIDPAPNEAKTLPEQATPA